MSRIDRIRRSLGLPEPRRAAPPAVSHEHRELVARPTPLAPVPRLRARADRIGELRREIARIESHWSRPAPAPRQHPAALTVGDGADETALPPMFRRETYEARRHRFGRYPVSQPARLQGTLDRLSALLPLIGEPSPDGEPPPPLRPDDLLFVDTETTGLSRAAGTLAFLVGVGRFSADGERYEVDQLLLREPGEEPELLERLAPYFDRARVIVSFNGRGFDLPILRNRSMVWRSPLPLDRPHLDLLHLSRRVFGGRTSNCRLGTLEREVLGFVRGDDIDGAEAPAIYLEFLNTGRVDLIDKVIEHNRLDVATMAPLMSLVVDHLGDPLHWAEDAEELLSVGRLHLGWGNAELGEQCLARGLELATLRGTRSKLLVELARIHRRRGDRGSASACWERYVAEFPDRDDGWIELAKHHEHGTKDLDRALAYAERAPRQHSDEVQHRIHRLRLSRPAHLSQ